MKPLATLVLFAIALGAAPLAAQPSAANNDVYKRLTQSNARVKSYKASVHLDVALKTFPYISPALDGNIYFKAPNRQAVVFDTVPALANQFKKVYPKIDAPSSWPRLYEMSVLGSEKGTTTFRLIPKHAARVEHLDVKVDDATATIRNYTWTYKDGGFVSFDQTFKSLDGGYFVERQTGRVELPSYKADVKSEFTNYKLNVPVPESVFEEK